MHRNLTLRKFTIINTVLFLLLVLTALGSVALGRYGISLSLLLSRLLPVLSTGSDWTPQMEAILFNVRLPRIFLACLVGCCLSAAGASYQGVFQNPMASPDILGASSGAAMGAALAILLELSSRLVMLFAFVASLITISLVMLVSRLARGSRLLGIILSGIMISSLCNAVTSFIKLVADPNNILPEITYWLMGSLAKTKPAALLFALVPMVIGLIPLIALRWRINLLTLSDSEARSMGVNVGRTRFAVIVCATLSYGKHEVLQKVCLTVREGEFLALLGPNGVGKSTLFNCMLGLTPKYSGSIRLGGMEIRKIPPEKLARSVAFVPQSHAPAFSYSVLDMALMGTTAQIGGLSAPGTVQIQIADSAIEKVGIQHLRERGFMELSGGERQLTLIARSLAQKSRIILMDEPTANLDYGNQLRVLTCVKNLTREGYTIIVSTHNPDHAFLFADRVTALSDGYVVADGTPKDTITAKLIKILYGVDVTIERGASGVYSRPPGRKSPLNPRQRLCSLIPQDVRLNYQRI